VHSQTTYLTDTNAGVATEVAVTVNVDTDTDGLQTVSHVFLAWGKINL
jgi:hypothetical protein